MTKLLIFITALAVNLSCLENREYDKVKKFSKDNTFDENSDDLTGTESDTRPEPEGRDDENQDPTEPNIDPEEDSSAEDEDDSEQKNNSPDEVDAKGQDDEGEPQPETISSYFVYVGANDRILHYELDQNNGAITEKSVFMLNNNPENRPNMALQIAIGKDQKFMYVGTEQSQSLQTLVINPDNGSLSLLNDPLDLGYSPVYLHVDDTGDSLVVSSYESDKVEVFPILADGTLSFDMNNRRELVSDNDEARFHSVITSPNNDFILFPNTGPRDGGISKLQGAEFDPINSSIANIKNLTDPNSAGPRHIRFHPKLAVFYAVNEYANSVTWYSWDDAGKNLTELDSILTLEQGVAATGSHTCADIHLTSDGRFLYASNRNLGGNDHSIAMFAVDEQTGSLSQIEGVRVPTVGKPREFAVDPLDKYLFVLGRDSPYQMQSFMINQASGQLELLEPYILLTSPTWVEVLTLTKEVEKTQ
ncbi:MAG: beta-propeller fold lactonase family protein [Oligoflexales bacterium]